MIVLFYVIGLNGFCCCSPYEALSENMTFCRKKSIRIDDPYGSYRLPIHFLYFFLKLFSVVTIWICDPNGILYIFLLIQNNKLEIMFKNLIFVPIFFKKIVSDF
ncbi:hypothetical protein AAZX31_08G280100 [Glycine max]